MSDRLPSVQVLLSGLGYRTLHPTYARSMLDDHTTALYSSDEGRIVVPAENLSL